MSEDLDIAKQPIPDFIKQVIFRTPQGLVFLIGTIAYLLVAILSHTDLGLIIFLVWVAAFSLFVFIAGIMDFKPSWIVAIIIGITTFWPLSWL